VAAEGFTARVGRVTFAAAGRLVDFTFGLADLTVFLLFTELTARATLEDRRAEGVALITFDGRSPKAASRDGVGSFVEVTRPEGLRSGRTFVTVRRLDTCPAGRFADGTKSMYLCFMYLPLNQLLHSHSFGYLYYISKFL
jgi:hypothetical protein